MSHWILRHKILLLLLAFMFIMLANLALFLPQYIHSEQQLTAAKLRQSDQDLGTIASQASTVAQDLAQQKIAPRISNSHLANLVDQANSLIVQFQSAPHLIPLDASVRQSLQLAQIISFTLRDLALQPGDQLKAATTSQILRQAATSAQTLSDTVPAN